MSVRSRKKTKDSMKKAFFELLSGNMPDKISVRMLCEQAEINRSTFYDYYESMPRFIESLQEDIAFECLRLIEPYKYDLDGEKIISSILMAIKDNPQLFSVFFDDRFNRKAQEIYKKELSKKSILRWVEKGSVSAEEAEIIYEYVTDGQFALWKYWLRNMDHLDMNDYAKTYGEIIHLGLRNVVYKNDTDTCTVE